MANLIKKYCLSVVIIAGLIITSVSFADDKAPLFSCVLTDTESADQTPGAANDTFAKDTAVIYLSCSSDQVTAGQKIKSTWIADDTNNVAPDNYTIEEKEIVISPEMANNEQGVTANFSLSKPTKGWPVGSYHVALSIDDKLDQNIKFSIK